MKTFFQATAYAALFMMSTASCLSAEAPAPVPGEASSGASQVAPLIVSRNIGDPVLNKWKQHDWVSASGKWTVSDERPAGVKSAFKTLHIEVSYPPRTFGGWGMEPVPALQRVPGKLKRITGYSRRSNGKAWCEIVLRDANDKEHKFGIPNCGEEWSDFVLEIPEKVVQPVTFKGFLFSNWGNRNDPNKSETSYDFFDFRFESDISDVPVGERPYGLTIDMAPVGNIFTAGEQPEMQVSATSWLGDGRDLRFSGIVESADGQKRTLKIPTLRCETEASTIVALPFDQPGGYTVTVEAEGFPEPQKIVSRYVVALQPPALTPEQKRNSPYGLNIHGGTYVDYPAFARLGFVWLRDYAYNYSWMVRARREGDYSGWPWPKKMLQTAEENGFMTLPCLMTGIQYKKDNPETPAKPTAEWRRNLAHFVASFDRLPSFELDNEVEGRADPFGNVYGAYHKAFADIVKSVRPDAWAVECGLAGIYPEAVRRHVLSGDFANIDVCNGHRYCGIDAPEYSRSNANTGQGEAKQTYLRDLFRNWKEAACLDGKDRQLWVTEWGWDTLAGQIVTEWEQAAYMQRCILLALGNGVNKMFWYWYYDSDTPNPVNFFDGCGIFNRFHEPKPIAAAYAALRTFLPADMTYVGYAYPAPNMMVHIYRIGDRYIAAAFKIRKDGPDYTLEKQPRAEKIYDMFGGKVDGKKARKLDIAPTWYIGLDKNHDWIRQTKIDVKSNWFVRNVSGEEIQIDVAPGAVYTVEPPKGWTSTVRGEEGFTVRSPIGIPRGAATILVKGTSDKSKKDIVIDVDIVPEAYVRTKAADFEGVFSASIVNQSISRKKHTLRAVVPAGWKVEPAEQSIELDPEERGNLTFRLAASAPIPASSDGEDYPRLEVWNENGIHIDSAPIVPREWKMAAVTGIRLDGDLRDWPIENRLPPWMIGPRGNTENSRFYMGYAKEGLYLGLEVADSKCFTSDPNSFWRAADCFELLFSAASDFTENRKWTLNDHQYWFCPLADQNRVFAGFWAHCEGQKIESDIQDIRSALRKTGENGKGGYVMEIFIPASRLNGYRPEKGAQVGIAFTLAVQGWRDNREVFWPAGKADGMVQQPWKWARVTLD